MRLVSELLIAFRIKENVTLDVRRKARRSALIHLTGDALLRGKAVADEIASSLAERGDEDELVVVTRSHLAKGIVEENRSRLRGDELVRFLQDLPQNEV